MFGKTPVFVGVPESVSTVKLIPLGSAPVSPNVYGAVPPLAVKVTDGYITPNVPLFSEAGLTVIAGQVTVSVTTLVSTDPQLFEYVALNFLPLSLSGGEYVSVGDVAPGTGLNVPPPSVDTIHCTLVKLLAAEVKVTGVLAVTL